MHVECPGCRRSVTVSEDLSASVILCPHCKGTVRLANASSVPGSEEEPAPPPRIELQRTCPVCDAKFPADRDRCPECRTNYEEARGLGAHGVRQSDMFAPERAVLSMGVWGGGLLILIAVVWFVWGWVTGYIFFYPPILAVIGIIGVWRGLAGRKQKPRRVRRRTGNAERHP